MLASNVKTLMLVGEHHGQKLLRFISAKFADVLGRIILHDNKVTRVFGEFINFSAPSKTFMTELHVYIKIFFKLISCIISKTNAKGF